LIQPSIRMFFDMSPPSQSLYTRTMVSSMSKVQALQNKLSFAPAQLDLHVEPFRIQTVFDNVGLDNKGV
jgi:hypothetical protein